MIKIRQADENDLGEIKILLKKLQESAEPHNEVTQIGFGKIFKEMNDFPHFYSNYVAVKDGDIIGFISIIFYKTLFHSGGTALINELIVSEDYRRKGVGKKLISKAIKIAKQRGMDEIEVGTEKKNIIAQSFYKKCGFNNEYILLSKTF